jgi:conjugal transfer pilus assembly protein TraW
MRYFSIILFGLLGLSVTARELPDIGPTFTIVEEDLELVIQKKLQSPEIKEKIQEFNTMLQQNTIEKTMRPTPVAQVTKAKVYRKFWFDPSTSIPYDLKDQKGKVFYRAHTKINPLTKVKLSSPLVFIDGDDPKQIKWLLKLKRQETILPTVILIAGEPFKLQALLKQEIFFDQGGFITSHFTISHVPALVRQKKAALLIEEIAL